MIKAMIMIVCVFILAYSDLVEWVGVGWTIFIAYAVLVLPAGMIIAEVIGEASMDPRTGDQPTEETPLCPTCEGIREASGSNDYLCIKCTEKKIFNANWRR